MWKKLVAALALVLGASFAVDAQVGGGVYNGALTAARIASALGYTPADQAASIEVIKSSGTQGAQLTGTTNETALLTIAVPPLGANDVLRITIFESHTNSANNKTLRARFGSISGAVHMTYQTTTTGFGQSQFLVFNNNATNAQKSLNGAALPFNTSTLNVTGTIDTSVATSLLITGQLASSGEFIRIEGYTVERIRGR